MNIADLCIRRPVFTWMLTLLPVVLGVVCYTKLKTSLFPVVDLPIVAVTTLLPGAGAEEVESQITKPIEEVINTCSGIEEVRSTSKEGVSTITVEFKMSKNRDAAAQEVRDKVGTLTNRFPTGTEAPIIDKFDIDGAPILTVAISADRSFQEVTELARKVVKEDIETVLGVGAVDLIGGWRRAVNVVVKPDQLRKYNLSIEQVRRAITEQNLEVPGGRVDQSSRELVLRTMGRVGSSRALLDIIVASPAGSPIRLRDVATVEDTFEEPRSLGRLRLPGDPDAAMKSGRNTVILSIQKQSGVNTVEVTDLVNARLAQLRKVLPSDLRMEVIRDQSKFTRASIEEVRFHLLLGAVLVSLTVLVFMKDWRTMLLASASIPVSLIATFVVMWAFGFSLDNITMIGLVLAVGIVIDDAVVVHENIFRFIEEKGLDPITASSVATREIALAVVATTLSLVVIFLPLAFLGGRIGPFFQGFGIVIASAVLISMWISFTMTPMFCSRFLRSGDPGHPHAGHGGFLYRRFDRLYGVLLRFSLRHRWLVVLMSVGVFVSIVPLGMMIGKDFIPKDDQGEIEVAFVTPEGWSLAESDTAARAVEETLLAEFPVIQKMLTTVGESSGRVAKAQGDVTSAIVYIGLPPLEDRTFHWGQALRDTAGLVFAGEPGLLLAPAELKARLQALQPHAYSQFEVAKRAREVLNRKFPDLRLAVREVAPFSGVGVRAGDLELNIRGPDLERLEEYSEKLMAGMRTIAGMVDIDSTLALRKPELRVRIDREGAARLGIRIATIASTLGSLVGGEVVGHYIEGAEQYDIWIRAAPDRRSDAERIADLTVPAPDGRLVPLRLLARLDEGRGPAQIDHYQRQRKVTVVCGLDGLPTGDAVTLVRQKAAELNLPTDYTLDFTGRAKTSGESGGNFLIAFGLGFVLMYMVLAAQFESFIHPITILLSVPLTIPFALISLIVMGQPLDIYAMFGLFMLFGIVKKNGILQVDYTNTLREQGMAREDAIVAANHTRLRPILMTTIMLVAGMIPIATGQGPGAGARASMAKVIVGGQALSLILTLLIVPVAYSLFDDAAILLRRVRAWLFGHLPAPATQASGG